MAVASAEPPVCPHCQQKLGQVLCCWVPAKETGRPPEPPVKDAEGQELKLLAHVPVYVCPHCRKVLGVLGSYTHNASYIGGIKFAK